MRIFREPLLFKRIQVTYGINIILSVCEPKQDGIPCILNIWLTLVKALEPIRNLLRDFTHFTHAGNKTLHCEQNAGRLVTRQDLRPSFVDDYMEYTVASGDTWSENAPASVNVYIKNSYYPASTSRNNNVIQRCSCVVTGYVQNITYKTL